MTFEDFPTKDEGGDTLFTVSLSVDELETIRNALQDSSVCSIGYYISDEIERKFDEMERYFDSEYQKYLEKVQMKMDIAKEDKAFSDCARNAG